MGKFTEFKIPLKSLPQGPSAFAYRLDKAFFDNMDSDDVHGAALDVAVTVDHTHDAYAIDMRVTGQVTLVCDRCLDDLPWPVDASYHVVVKYGEAYDDSSDDMLVIPESDNYLNVAYMLRDTVALDIPIKHVHPAGKCNRRMTDALRRHTVAADPDEALEQQLIDEIDDAEPSSNEGNTDPRWDALRGLASPEDN